ncbi:MAG: hypothetical protein DMF84_12905 [Acidobacteria bacterium]|nr:MAG: hypothetical protein DMF84_12905 [Acidobacteriota bacterium]
MSERSLDAPKRWPTLNFGATAPHDRTRHRPGLRRRCNTARTTTESSVSRKYTAYGKSWSSTDLTIDDGELLRRFPNAREQLLDVRQKARTKTRSLIVVPAGGLLEIGFRKLPNDDSPAIH